MEPKYNEPGRLEVELATQGRRAVVAVTSSEPNLKRRLRACRGKSEFTAISQYRCLWVVDAKGSGGEKKRNKRARDQMQLRFNP
jgi:hypothetical protein